jgi:ubiquitin-like protein Pup
MEKQERRPESRKESHSKEEVKPNPKVVESGKKLKEDIDKLVDEIDDVLEKECRRVRKELCAKGRGVVPLPFSSRSPSPHTPVTVAHPWVANNPNLGPAAIEQRSV